MRKASDLDGILVIDKPAGWTSHDVVAKARRITGQRRIGHTGTLDPMATGVLVLCLGQATRLVEYMTVHDKQYEAVIEFGTTTSTDDAEGDVLQTRPVPPLTPELLSELEVRFTGTVLQRPPSVSAIHIDGERAYDLARAGTPVDLPERPVRIDALTLRPAGTNQLSATVACGPGTYIRSLARDMGTVAGCGAHLTALRRTSVGRFDLAEAVTLEQLERCASAKRLDLIVLPADEGITEMDAALVRAEHALALRQGAVVTPLIPAVREAGPARIYDPNGSFLGVGSVLTLGQIRGSKVLNLKISDEIV